MVRKKPIYIFVSVNQLQSLWRHVLSFVISWFRLESSCRFYRGMHPEMSDVEVEEEVGGVFRKELRKFPERRIFSAFPLHPQWEGIAWSYFRAEENGKLSEEPSFCLTCSEIPESRGLRGKGLPKLNPASATSSELRSYQRGPTGNEARLNNNLDLTSYCVYTNGCRCCSSVSLIDGCGGL